MRIEYCGGPFDGCVRDEGDEFASSVVGYARDASDFGQTLAGVNVAGFYRPADQGKRRFQKPGGALPWNDEVT